MSTQHHAQFRDSRRRAIAEVVAGICRELQGSALWECERPSVRRLSSDEPFSYDTLMFHQWLQWQFLPRMQAILADGGELPRESAIHPYAEECLADQLENPEPLLFLLKAFDELISGDWHQESADVRQ